MYFQADYIGIKIKSIMCKNQISNVFLNYFSILIVLPEWDILTFMEMMAFEAWNFLRNTDEFLSYELIDKEAVENEVNKRNSDVF